MTATKHSDNWFQRYSHCHRVAFQSSLQRLKHTPIANFLTITVIALALTLPTGLYLVLQNIQSAAESLPKTTQIALFLKVETTEQDAQTLLKELKNHPDIALLHYISPEEGLSQFEEHTGVNNLLSKLTKNPLPAVIEVTPTQQASNEQALEALIASLKKHSVIDDAVLDMAWVKRLQSIVSYAKQVSDVLLFIFSAAVLLIIGNTIRLSLQRYRQEIEVLQFIGATPTFIRRPFLYMGFFYGLYATTLAWLMIHGALWWLQSSAEELAALYQSHFQLQGLSFSDSFDFLLVGTLLGITGAWLAVRRNQLNPLS